VKFRSAVSNGSSLLPEIDGRSVWARRLRDLVNDHVSDLGGADLVSTSEMNLVRRAAMLTLQLELQEHVWAVEREGRAGPKSLQLYQQCTNTLRRTLEALGLRRRQRDVTPDLDTYVARHYSRDADDAEACERWTDDLPVSRYQQRSFPQ
jgi:hypothetical protein